MAGDRDGHLQDLTVLLKPDLLIYKSIFTSSNCLLFLFRLWEVIL